MQMYKPGDILLDKYRIEDLVGQGAFAEVYKVTHLKLNSTRAIKVLHKDKPGLGSTEFSEYQERFQFEARLGERFKNPNIIQVIDFDQDGNELILAMEYAAGGSLEKLIETLNANKTLLPINTAIKMAIDVANGLAELHAQDVIHRDIKPSNILFDAKGRAKVADLGLAQTKQSMRSLLSNPPPNPGTPAYMSPEQKSSTNYLNSASDVFALGLVLFEALTGRIYRNQRSGTRASSLRSDIPAWLDDLIVQMLSDLPENRPWDGKEVAEFLRKDQEKALLVEQANRDRSRQLEEEQARQITSAAEAEKKRLADQANRDRTRQLDEERARQTAIIETAEKKRLLAEREARLISGIEKSIASGNWGRASAAILELKKLSPESQEKAARLQEKLEHEQKNSWQVMIPLFIVGAVGLVGLFVAVVFLIMWIFPQPAVPVTPAITATSYPSPFPAATRVKIIPLTDSPLPKLSPWAPTLTALPQSGSSSSTADQTPIPQQNQPIACTLRLCGDNDESVCIKSVAPLSNSVIVAFKVTPPLTSDSEIPYLLVDGINYKCELISTYPDRLYCTGAPVSGMVSLQINSQSNSTLCSGEFFIPQYIAPAPTAGKKPSNKKGSPPVGTYP